MKCYGCCLPPENRPSDAEQKVSFVALNNNIKLAKNMSLKKVFFSVEEQQNKYIYSNLSRSRYSLMSRCHSEIHAAILAKCVLLEA